MTRGDELEILTAKSYDLARTLAGHEDKLILVMGFCCISFLGAYMQYFGAVKNGFKDKTYAIPLGCNLWFFAHDTTYVSMFSYWFSDLNHWLPKAFWFALFVFACLELVLMFQMIRYARRDLFGQSSVIKSVGLLVLCQVGAYIVFWSFHSLIIDPLYLISFTTTVLFTPLLTIPMMFRRNSKRGFSPFMLWGYILLAIGFYPWIYCVDPFFQSPLYIALGIVNVILAIACLAIYRHLPDYEPATG